MARESKRTRHEKRFGRPERLIDAVNELRWRLPNWIDHRHDSLRDQFVKMRDDDLKAISCAVSIEASNVAEFFYSTSSKEEWIYQDDFHCFTLPFQSVFIEMRRPSRINSEGEIHSSSGLPDQWGWLFSSTLAQDRASEFNEGREERIQGLVRSMDSIWPKCNHHVVQEAIQKAVSDGPSGLNGFPIFERNMAFMYMQYAALTRIEGAVLLDDGTKWFVDGKLFLRYGDSVATTGGCSYRVSESGLLMDQAPVWQVLGGHCLTESELNSGVEIVSLLSQAAFMGLSFMGCKNVSTEEHAPDAKLNRARAKAGLKPLLRYHTINIEPMKRVLRTEGDIEANGLKKALHICRGHFRRYTEEKPLFGHTSGLVWTPSHVRGSAKEGVVVSDYKVNSPAAPKPA